MSMPSGAALAEAMTSAKVLTGKGGVTTEMFGTSDTRATEEARAVSGRCFASPGEP
jgi:hypothetical protein